MTVICCNPSCEKHTTGETCLVYEGKTYCDADCLVLAVYAHIKDKTIEEIEIFKKVLDDEILEPQRKP